ncbi:hypothetical protein FGLOB1_13418 [Fusarium globosum]|uniref:Uncharacterized protein n=1 Tax=Fusarium globosum TaxID=78864 RepID=A0A8H5XN45_9HYPO|nr:hypothetical protein FGLOB1_13418 [Fusarium globosum]
MIMEINNSFDEKRNVLFRVDPNRSEHGEPRNALYTGYWKKEVYASPFERVEGKLVEKVADPLHAADLVSGKTLTITSAVSDEGKLKFTTRISLDGAPIDPTGATFLQMLRILVQWTLPGTLTTPRIIFQAMRIHHYLGTMKMKTKPVIRPGSVPRHATKSERVLERAFRQWITFILDENSKVGNWEIDYKPSISNSNDIIRLKPEHLGSSSPQTPPVVLKVEVVDPSFYRALVQAKNIGEVLAEQMTPRGDDADPLTCAIVVSDAALLRKLAARSGLAAAPPPPNASGYALDHFVHSHADVSLASAYRAVTRRYRVADYLLLGSRWIS